MNDFRSIPIDLVKESANNPRRHFDEGGLADLTASVKAKGILMPLLVRSVNGHFETLDGARRLRAATAAGLLDIPARVINVTDKEALEIMVIANLQREDVHPLDEANGYKQLIQQAGYDVAAIAAKVGKSESYVYQRLKLAELIEPAQKAFWADEINAGHAVLIARLQPKDQKDALEQVIQYDSSTRDLANWIDRQIHLDLKKAGFDPEDPGLVKGVLGCDICPKRTGTLPSLFPEIKKKDTCTDPACFHAKEDAWVKMRLKVQEEHGEPLVKLSTEYLGYQQKPKDGAIHSSSFTVIEKKKDRCEHAREGIVVAGNNKGKVLTVCADPKCKEHRGTTAQRDPKQAEQNRKAKLELEIAKTIRGRLVTAICESGPHEPTVTCMENWAEAWWGRLGHDIQVLIRKRHDWDADTLPVGDLGEAQLVEMLNEFSMAGELQVFSYCHEKGVPQDLQERADEIGLSWQAIEKRVQDEFAAKGKKKATPKSKQDKDLEAKRTKETAAQKKQASGRVWPQPTEFGVYEEHDCTVVECPIKGSGTAAILVIQAEDGWRAEFTADIANAGTGAYPGTSSKVFERQPQAIGEACKRMIAWAENVADISVGGKKQKAQCVFIISWARKLKADSEDLDSQLRVGAEERDPHDPEYDDTPNAHTATPR